MSGLGLFLLVLTWMGFAFGWGVVVGHSWRVLDKIEARLLDKIASLRKESR